MRKSRTEQAYRSLYELITSGRITPGSGLSEVELSESLSMSRTPVREALHQLETDGLLERKNGRLAVVEITYSRVAHLFVLRAAVDGMAARLATLAATPKDVAKLEALLADAEAATKRGELTNATELSVQFHNAIVAMSRNKDLEATSRQANALIRRFEHVTAPGLAGRSLAWHRAIFEALKRGDPDGCELLMRRDILGAGAEILPILQSVIGIDEITPSVELIIKHCGTYGHPG